MSKQPMESNPAHSETDAGLLERLLRLVIRGLVPVVALVVLLDAIQSPGHLGRWGAIVGAAAAVAGLAALLVRRRRAHAAAIVLVAGGWATITVTTVTSGGTLAPDASIFAPWVFAGGLLLGRRGGYVCAAIALVTLLVIAAAQHSGHLGTDVRYNPLMAWATHGFNLWLILALHHIASTVRDETLAESKRQLAERRRAEASAAESERKVRALFDSVQDGVLVLDAETGVILELNRRACEILEAKPQELVGQGLYAWAGSDPAYPASTLQRHARDAATGTPQAFEWRCGTRHGNPVWAEIRMRRTEVLGRPRVLASVRQRDRSEAEGRRLVQALQESEERYRIVAEQTGQIVYDYDIATGRIQWEGAIEVITGRSRAEFARVDIGTWETMIHPEDRERAAAELDSARKAGRVYHTGYRFARKDGTFAHIEDTGIFLCDVRGEPFRMLGSMKDVSHSKRAELRLLEVNQRINFHFERMPLGYIAWNREFRVTEWNPAAETIFGWSAGEAMGRHAYDLIVPAPVRETVDRIWSDLLAGGGWSAQAVNDNCRKDGTVITCEWFNAPLRDERGEITGCLSIVNDITERRRAEQAEARLKAELVQAQKLQALGTLAGGIAHDFNNLLTAIMGNVRMAADELPREATAHLRLNAIDEATHRAANLVRQILTFSRREPSQRKLLDAAATADEALKLLRATVPAMIQFRTEFSDIAAPILADPTQLHQIVMNLGTNAAQAIGDRAGTVTFRIDSIDSRSATGPLPPELAPGRYTRLAISDTGSGMDAETRERIFEPFFTTKARGRGTGLGLSVVHGIVQAHHGAIAVESEPGHGTTFEVYFPAAEGLPEPDFTTDTAEWGGHGEHILVLDDEQTIVQLFTTGLARHRYRCTGFTDPRVALEAFLANPADFDAVITDFAMPSMSGAEFIAALRRIRPELPILLMSGFIQGDTVTHLESLGVTHLVQKPVSVRDMGKELDCLLYWLRQGRAADTPSA